MGNENVTRLAPQRKRTAQIRHKMVPVEQNLRALTPDPTVLDVEKTAQDFSERKRVKYAMMRSHMEIASVVIAAGGSYDMAAAQAGVSARQIRKYVSDSDFRARVEEHRELLMGRVKGRIQKEFERRTEPEKIKQLEMIDLARIYDRTGAGTEGAASGEGIHNYDRIIQQVFIANAGPESSDFPEYGDEDFSVSEPGAQERSQIPGGGRGEADR